MKTYSQVHYTEKGIPFPKPGECAIFDLFKDSPIPEDDQCPMCFSKGTLVETLNATETIGNIVVRGLDKIGCTACSEYFFLNDGGERFAAAGDRHVLNERRRASRDDQAVQARWEKRKISRALGAVGQNPQVKKI